MKKTYLILLMAVLTIFLISCNGASKEFAQCLTEKGVKMYGADWCPHCKEQKLLFGSSFSEVNYIECALEGGGQREVCNFAGITSYPTWVFEDGTREVGKLSLEDLSLRSGCLLE